MNLKAVSGSRPTPISLASAMKPSLLLFSLAAKSLPSLQRRRFRHQGFRPKALYPPSSKRLAFGATFGPDSVPTQTPLP